MTGLTQDRPPLLLRSTIVGLLAGAGVLPWPYPSHVAHATHATHLAPDAVRTQAAPPSLALPTLPPGSRFIPLGNGMFIQGLSMWAYAFEAPMQPADLATWLTARQPALRDTWVMPDAVVLSGIAEGVHWVARMSDVGAGRTRGTISALPTARHIASPDPSGSAGGERSVAGAAGAASGPAVQAASWRLPGGHLQFELRSLDDDVMVVQQVWTHASAPLVLGERLARELERDGWREAGGGAARQQWTRGRVTLLLTIVPLDQGSGVNAVVRIGA
ncbi:hypothetical protein CAL12_09570 [Bordetella genomosp. 8]|uniref:Uncharacterized protein n=2 Tax=Bordetella genomosp. 8 TaxID=1416806 RepID=A0A1W6YJ25_9BORD|nr:hypothetical protein CAL12_09570 [Bordetella genomosp. 8]